MKLYQVIVRNPDNTEVLGVFSSMEKARSVELKAECLIALHKHYLTVSNDEKIFEMYRKYDFVGCLAWPCIDEIELDKCRYETQSN